MSCCWASLPFTGFKPASIWFAVFIDPRENSTFFACSTWSESYVPSTFTASPGTRAATPRSLWLMPQGIRLFQWPLVVSERTTICLGLPSVFTYMFGPSRPMIMPCTLAASCGLCYRSQHRASGQSHTKMTHLHSLNVHSVFLLSYRIPPLVSYRHRSFDAVHLRSEPKLVTRTVWVVGCLATARKKTSKTDQMPQIFVSNFCSKYP